MAKQIKAIKCPQCGSNKVTELRADYYRCNSCNTEFFLDNDDINININQRNNAPPPVKINKIAALVGGLFFLLFTFMILGGLFRGKKPVSPASYEQPERWWHSERCFYEATDKTPVYMVYGERTAKDANDQPTVAMYNAETGKLINMTELPVKKIDIMATAYRIFEDGTPYVIINNLLYKVDRQLKKIVQVLPADFPSQPALQAGFAKIEFVFEDFGSGFNIITNDGKHIYYYPISGQAFLTEDEWLRYDQLPFPNDKQFEKTMYKFSNGGSPSGDEKNWLIQYRRWYAKGFAVRSPNFDWKDGTAVMKEYSKKDSKIIDWKNFTPGRNYFDSKILDYNDKYVLLKFKATPAEEAQQNIQLLDAATAQVLWTLPVPPSDGAKPVDVVAFDGYFAEKGILVTTNFYAIFLDYKGNIIHKFSTP